MKLSIIIPVYHEEKNIEKVLQVINEQVKTPHEILVVYDSKDDPTYPVLKRLSKKRAYGNVFPVKNAVGTGDGIMNAVKTGFRSAKGMAIVMVMADLSDNVSQMDHMYALIHKKGWDIVCASRYMKGGRKIGGPLIKTFLSFMAGLTLHHIFGVPTHDSTNAFKMYKRDLLKDIQIESTGGFEFSMEIVLRAYRKGYKITEIPTVWRDREEGVSSFKLIGWLPAYIRTYLLILGRKLS